MDAPRPAMSPSPASVDFPVLKQNAAVKPNPHPYAIRTTSTGVLTRSNSSGHNAAAGKHHYVPLLASPTRKREDRLHRKHSKSLDIEGSCFDLSPPQPLPVPASFLKNASQENTHDEGPRFVRRRAETLPTALTSDGTFLASVEADSLPTNPKSWTPSQLASYLLSVLQAQEADASDAPAISASAISDIAKFVQDTNISGRIFLRLNEEDMASMSIDVSWRDALLVASRNLRQNVLKGRIWGAGQDSPPSGTLAASLPSQPFSPIYDSYSSASSAELTSDEEDLGVSRRRKVRGRVRGLIESFERSGSFGSSSDVEDQDSPQLDRSTVKRWLGGKVVPEDAMVLSPTSPTKSLIKLELPLEKSGRPPADFVEEPSVEVLLAETEAKSVGVRAWEAFDTDACVTVKRVPEPAAEDDAQRIVDLTADPDKKVRSLPRHTLLIKRKQERRVVTAVFAPSSAEPASPVDKSLAGPVVAQDQAVQATAGNKPEDSDALVLLTAELKESRLLVEDLTRRLHDVESRNLELEKLVAAQELELTKARDVAAVEVRSPGSQACPHCRADTDPDTRLDETTSPSTSSLLAFSSSFLPTAVRQALPATLRPSGTGNREDTRRRRRPPPDELSTMSDIPQYALLVGLGVCVVVLRLMLKKAAGRRS